MVPRWLLRFSISGCLLILSSLLLRGRVFGQTSLTVSMSVDDTVFAVFGLTSPRALVTITESGAVVATTTTDQQGTFHLNLPAQVPGLHTFKIYATDHRGLATATVSYPISLTAQTETSLGEIVLPPSLRLAAGEVNQGDFLTILGSAPPWATVSLFFTGGSRATQVIAGEDGSWEYRLETSDLAAGSAHDVSARVSTVGGRQSEVSTVLAFKIRSATPELPPLLKVFDLDQTGRIEPTEVAEVVRRWVESWQNKVVSSVCDLDSDDRCTLVDFSILLYYVGR